MAGYLEAAAAEVLGQSGVCVFGRGMGLQHVAYRVVKEYASTRHLMLLLNMEQSQVNAFNVRMQEDDLMFRVTSIGAEVTPVARQELYLAGGCYSITNRILIVDLLHNVLPRTQVTGVLVWNAQTVSDSSSEAFILRLLMQGITDTERRPFVKAFSSSPETLSSSILRLESVLRSLHVEQLLLWPRFRSSVQDALADHPLDVVEIAEPLTPSVEALQGVIYDVVDICIEELRRCQPNDFHLDGSNGFDSKDRIDMTRRVDYIIRRQLDDIWHEVGPKTRQLIQDVALLRCMLTYLMEYDCITFHEFLLSIRESNSPRYGSQYTKSLWMYTDPAQRLFRLAKRRVYHVSAPLESGKRKRDETTVELNLEENPKWGLLVSVLEEVKEDHEQAENDVNLLVVAKDMSRCHELLSVVQHGAARYMMDCWHAFAKRKLDASSRASKSTTEHERWKSINEFTTKAPQANFVGPMDRWIKTQGTQVESELNEEHRGDLLVQLSSGNMLHIFFRSRDGLDHELDSLCPTTIVLFDPSFEAVRQIELYRALRPGIPIRLYFLVFDKSFEEECYKAALERENMAFENLAQNKAIMVVPKETDSKVDKDRYTQNKSGRTAGRGKVPGTILVDMREFRSSLPGSLHRDGTHIVPITLEVADYVLSPEIGVERKALMDLIGSLNSGRLYNQLTALCREYTVPILLIEFDPQRRFSLQSESLIPDEISPTSIMSKLVVTSIHFPSVRFVWSRSPQATSQLFMALKENQKEPSAPKSGFEKEQEKSDQVTVARDLLRKVPGMNGATMMDVMNSKFRSIADLLLADQREVAATIGKTNAKRLHKFSTVTF